MRITTFLLTLGLAGAVAVPIGAEPDGAADPTTAEAAADEERGWVPLGDRTRDWMDRQRGGLEASPHATGLTPPEDYRARRRHLDSFSHPIPDFYDFETLGGSGG